MAATTRAVTPTHTPFAPASAAPNTPTSTLHPNTTSALRASPSKSPHTRSPRLSPQPLTGAAVMAEERRAREQKTREEAQATSPNPAMTALNALISSDAQMSQRKEGGPAAVAQMSEPLQKVAKSIVIPENNNITSDNMQTSPVSLSSFGSVDNTTHAPTATAMDTTAPAPFPVDNMPGQTRAQVEQAAQSTGGHENAADRSFTFPGPLNPEQDPRAPQRGMSLPMSGYAQNNPKSPNKRHKCPYCSTDFTRHHNLKSHLLTHSQEKPYECPDCHARFRRLHDLKRHTKLHTGERPHICPKCGRRFARGDALARHNKGQGGCAGRRSSFGMDEDMSELRDGDAMDGLEYSHASPSDEQHDPAATSTPRRISEPSRRASGRQHSTSSTAGYTTSQHGSTYPPVVAATRTPNSTTSNNSLRPIYPPSGPSTRDASMANTSSSPGSKPGAPSLSAVHFAAAAAAASASSAGVYSPHGGMTESPKPLSPGQPAPPAAPADHLLPPGARSPNPSLHAMTPASFSRGGAAGMPPPGASAPTLPQLPGLGGAGVTDPRLTGAGAKSNPSSLSSHGGASASGGSGGSLREILARSNHAPGDGGAGEVWSYIRDLEARNAAREREYEARIAGLEREVRGLRGELHERQSASANSVGAGQGQGQGGQEQQGGQNQQSDGVQAAAAAR